MAAVRHQQPAVVGVRADRVRHDADPTERGMYAFCSAISGVFMAVITFWAGYAQVMDIYLPHGQYLLASMAVLAMVLMLIVFIGAFRKWSRLLAIN